MKKFLIERKLPGAFNLTSAEIEMLTRTSTETILNMTRRYQWEISYITEDAIFCIHLAESESAVREHAKSCQFPINNVYEIVAEFKPAP